MIGAAASAFLLRPSPCLAAQTAAELPWDQTLLALQNTLVGTVAPAVIGFAFAGAVVLYALGGHDEQAGRLFGSGIGGCIALAIVHLLNYVAL
jgi:type IV secretory pathway VirB2 component (pilin)